MKWLRILGNTAAAVGVFLVARDVIENHMGVFDKLFVVGLLLFTLVEIIWTE